MLTITLCIILYQACQQSVTDPIESYALANAGTEEMWIDTDGTPYLYYTGLDGRYYIIAGLMLDVLQCSNNSFCGSTLQRIESFFEV